MSAKGRKGNLAESTVLSTVILTSTLCVIVFTASYVANDAINAQIENAQFDQAENVMLALDKMIKRILYKPDSSGYVKTSFWTTTPYLAQTGENLSVTVWNGEQKELELTVPVNLVKIKGGSRTSVSTDKDLIGNGSLLLTDFASSLGRVRAYQLAGAWVTLDYFRVRCINSGTMQYYNGTGYEPYNLIEITVVKMVFGDFEVEERASFTVKNKGSVLFQEEISKGSNFTVDVQKSGVEETRTLEQLGGNPNYRSLVNLVVVNVEISILGGA